MLLHFITNLGINPPRKYLYCGNCLSFNLKIYEGKGEWNVVIYVDDKCECLDCGWKGDSKTCLSMSKGERDNKYLNINRRNKIKKIMKIYESRCTC